MELCINPGMIKTLTHPVFILAVLLATINQLAERNGIFLPIIHSYLDDVLCFPIMLTTGLSVYRLAWPDYRLSPWHIWPLFFVVVFLFEIYLPKTSEIYTADPLDILAYLVGIYIFSATINQPTEKTLAHKKTPHCGV